MTVKEPNQILECDVPKISIDEDVFELKKLAEVVANNIVSRVGESGYIVGIEGEWGSGKTTLLNFICDIINRKKQHQYRTFRFEPWAIGNKEILLQNYFSALLAELKVLRSEYCQHPTITENIDSLIVNIAQYSSYFAAGAAIATQTAVIFPNITTPIVGAFLTMLAELSKKLQKPLPTLEQLKDSIISKLKRLATNVPNLRIIVLIDDTDRLDPVESTEIMRLIKAVANFPFVTYVVCFDRNILADQICQTLSVDGERYLDKIFQQVVTIPPQEPFALRRLFIHLLNQSFPDAMSLINSDDKDIEYRKYLIFDMWVGDCLSTPRDVKLLYESIKFGWPSIEGKADFLDYVWLQCIKFKHRNFYYWVKDYLTALASLRDGGRPGDTRPITEAEKLRVILNSISWFNQHYEISIRYLLPGLAGFRMEGLSGKVFDFENDEITVFERNKRLGSPTHWRLYFAFDNPTYAVSDEFIEHFKDTLVSNAVEAKQIINSLATKPHTFPGHHLNVFFDRIKGQKTMLSDKQQVALLNLCAEIFDSLPYTPFNPSPDIWITSLHLFDNTIGEEFVNLAANGQSICWLSRALKNQAFAIGIHNDYQADVNRQWLTRDQFDRSLSALIIRFKHLGICQICTLPHASQILHCWLELGDQQELRELIEYASKDDKVFIDIVKALRGWSNSSDKGIYQSIRLESIRPFMDDQIVKSRLHTISVDLAVTKDIQKEALELVSNLERF